MNIKMATNLQLSTTECEKTNQANHHNRNRITDTEITWKTENGEKVQGIRSINGRYKIDRGRLRIV